MKKIVTSILFILMLTFPAFAMKNNPDGFRGVKWGMKPDQVEGIDLAEQFNNDLWYQKQEDKLTLGGATLQGVYYVFDKEHGFYQAILQTEGEENYIELLIALKAWFSSPTSIESDVRQWIGKDASVHLGYNENSFISFVTIASTPLLKKVGSPHPMTKASIYQIKNTPEDFMGVKWNAKPEDVEGLKLLEETSPYTIYSKEGDVFEAKDAKFEDVQYAFHKDHGFTYAIILSKGRDNYDALESELENRFGPSKHGNPNSSVWQDDDMYIQITYQSGNDETKCVIASNKTLEKINYDENKAYMDNLSQDF